LVVEPEFAAAVETAAAELEGVLVTVRTEGVDRTADDDLAVEVGTVEVDLLVEADDGAADELDWTAEDEEMTTLLEATAVVLVRYVLATVVLLLASVVPCVAAPAAAGALDVVTVLAA
jgi:hypothetical protein